MMVIYEVNLYVKNTVAEDAGVWLRRHIKEMLQIDGFQKARWYYQEPRDDQQLWTVQYHVETVSHLERYLETDAVAMRADAADRFGDLMRAERRLLFERETFK